MEKLLDERHHELLAQVASMYYERDLTQTQIADELGLSRVKIYRLLQEARQHNIVQINIRWPLSSDNGLETALKETFGLKEAMVVRANGQNETRTLQQLGQLGARYLETILRHTTTMAICLGRSTYSVIHAISPDFQANVQVAQAIGNMPRIYKEFDSSALVAQLARKLGGEVTYLSSPLMADTIEAASVIRSQRDIVWALDVARSAEVALVGIGNLDTEISGFVRAGFLSDEALADIRSDGAVGDVAWRIITESGELYPCDFNHRVIGITLEELRQIPTTIAVAAGMEKAQAVLAALRTGVIDVLITDNRVAEFVLRNVN
ncbi:MAG: sugar-binding transcriptional regulator [Anaerolineae bacterium]